MEEKHKVAIQTHYLDLVNHCDARRLIPVLVQKNVFSPEMVHKFKSISDREGKQWLFLDIQKRGPRAFSKLVTSLRESNQTYLANLLDPNSSSSSRNSLRRHATPFMLPVDREVGRNESKQLHNLVRSMPSNACINFDIDPISIKVTPSTVFYDNLSNTSIPTYNTHSKNRGAVLIINIIQYDNDTYTLRRGAEVDGRNLKELFLQMGFVVQTYVNITGSQIMNAIKEFKSSFVDIEVDMAFVIIMGHGKHDEDGTKIIGRDNVAIEARWIERQFDNKRCLELRNKPKIILYQTCRGDMPDYGTSKVEMDSAVQTFEPSFMRMRTCNDLLIAHSTIPGFASHRDIQLGTWYISIFCSVMMKHAHNTHLEDIFKIIDDELSSQRSAERSLQTSMYINLGFKTCYVHPGIYLENGLIKNINDSD